MLIRKRLVLSMATVGMIVLCAGSVSGQVYPNKPIRVLAPEPGGGNEIVGRIVGQGLSVRLGQQFVIENRGAGGGVIAAGILQKAAPDGYTLMVYGPTIWLAQLLRKDVSYDVLKDFTPISLLTSAPSFIFVNASVPANSIKELIALAKAKPGALNYGASSAPGAATHLDMELFKSMAGVNIMRIGYKGSGPASIGLASGEVQMMIGSASLGMEQVKTGKVRVLAITSPKPSELAPGVPTVADSGLPGFETGSRVGLFGPGKMPKAIINRLSQEVVELMKQPDLRKRLLSIQVEPDGTTPEKFSEWLKGDMNKWGKIIKDAGIVEE